MKTGSRGRKLLPETLFGDESKRCGMKDGSRGRKILPDTLL